MFALNSKNFISVTLVSAFLALTCDAAGTPIRVKLAGRDLAPFDPFDGLPDAYVIVSYAFGSSEEYQVLNQTGVINDSQNPEWNETFDVDFVPGTSQRLRFEVWDSDLDGDDKMGVVDIFLAEVNNAVDQPVEKYFLVTPENGKLLIQNIAGSTNKTVVI